MSPISVSSAWPLQLRKCSLRALTHSIAITFVWQHLSPQSCETSIKTLLSDSFFHWNNKTCSLSVYKKYKKHKSLESKTTSPISFPSPSHLILLPKTDYCAFGIHTSRCFLMLWNKYLDMFISIDRRRVKETYEHIHSYLHDSLCLRHHI